jgi:hypothetical protein
MTDDTADGLRAALNRIVDHPNNPRHRPKTAADAMDRGLRKLLRDASPRAGVSASTAAKPVTLYDRSGARCETYPSIKAASGAIGICREAVTLALRDGTTARGYRVRLADGAPASIEPLTTKPRPTMLSKAVDTYLKALDAYRLTQEPTMCPDDLSVRIHVSAVGAAKLWLDKAEANLRAAAAPSAA